MPNLFLTGHRKSGTSMLSRLFDSHPELSLYPTDISLLYAYFPGYVAAQREPEKLRKRISVVMEKALRYGLGLSGDSENHETIVRAMIHGVLSRLSDDALTRRKDVLNALVMSWREVAGASDGTGVVLKETSQAIHFRALRESLPNTRFLHLMRDPRDTYAAIKAGVTRYYSALGEGERASLASVLNRVQVDTRAARSNAAMDPESFSIVRFEDLVANPQAEMSRIAAFAGIAYDDCLLTPSVGGAPYGGNSHDGLVMKGISAQNSGRWRERISDEEAMIIEFWLGDDMEDCGYRREFPESDATAAFSAFYDWYNTKYFYFDSFKPEEGA